MPRRTATRRCAIPYTLQATLWVIGSALVYLAAAHLLRYLEGRPDAPVSRFVRRGESLGLGWAVKLAYFVGVPYAAMLLGAADFPAHMGLARLDWPTSIGKGVVAGAAVFAGLAGASWHSIRSLRRLDADPLPKPSSLAGLPLILNALCNEAHWAFYRLPGILLTGDLFLGTWIGAAVAVLERVGDPRWRRRAVSPEFGLEAWQHIALLGGMSAAFFFTRNFFVVWAAHALVEWGSWAVTQRMLAEIEKAPAAQ